LGYRSFLTHRPFMSQSNWNWSGGSVAWILSSRSPLIGWTYGTH